MTLQQLNYLAQVVECGSINKASKRLFISQSCISAALRELEQEMGISIFTRNSRGVELTEEGRGFFESVAPILKQEKKVLDLYIKKGGPSTMKLRVSAQHYPFVAHAFVDLLRLVGEEKYDLQLHETNTYYIIEDIMVGNSDLGVLYLSNANEQFIRKVLERRELEFHLIKKSKPHVFLRKDHPLAQQEEIEAHQLDNYPYVTFDSDDSHADSLNFSEEVVLVGFEPSQCIVRINDRCTMYNVLVHSDAFSIGSGLLSAGFYDPGVVTVPLSDPVDEVQIGYIHRKNATLNQTALDFIALLRSSVEQAEMGAACKWDYSGVALL